MTVVACVSAVVIGTQGQRTLRGRDVEDRVAARRHEPVADVPDTSCRDAGGVRSQRGSAGDRGEDPFGGPNPDVVAVGGHGVDDSFEPRDRRVVHQVSGESQRGVRTQVQEVDVLGDLADLGVRRKAVGQLGVVEQLDLPLHPRVDALGDREPGIHRVLAVLVRLTGAVVPVPRFSAPEVLGAHRADAGEVVEVDRLALSLDGAVAEGVTAVRLEAGVDTEERPSCDGDRRVLGRLERRGRLQRHLEVRLGEVDFHAHQKLSASG